MATIRAGRRIGSKVKLNPRAERYYPQFAGRVGVITDKMILTKGDGLAQAAYRKVAYKVSYFVRFQGGTRSFLLGADNLMSVVTKSRRA